MIQVNGPGEFEAYGEGPVADPKGGPLPGPHRTYTVPPGPAAGRRAAAAIVLGGVVAALLSGCPALDNPYRPLPEPDEAMFEAKVQPVVARRCAALGCHGRTEMALTLYAVGLLRAPPAFAGQPLDEDALTPAELAWNYDALRLRLLDESDPDDAYLLRKCLAPAHGGIRHAGGVVVFDSPDAPDYRVLRDWIATGVGR